MVIVMAKDKRQVGTKRRSPVGTNRFTGKPTRNFRVPLGDPAKAADTVLGPFGEFKPSPPAGPAKPFVARPRGEVGTAPLEIVPVNPPQATPTPEVNSFSRLGRRLSEGAGVPPLLRAALPGAAATADRAARMGAVGSFLFEGSPEFEARRAAENRARQAAVQAAIAGTPGGKTFAEPPPAQSQVEPVFPTSTIEQAPPVIRRTAGPAPAAPAAPPVPMTTAPEGFQDELSQSSQRLRGLMTEMQVELQGRTPRDPALRERLRQAIAQERELNRNLRASLATGVAPEAPGGPELAAKRESLRHQGLASAQQLASEAGAARAGFQPSGADVASSFLQLDPEAERLFAGASDIERVLAAKRVREAAGLDIGDAPAISEFGNLVGADEEARARVNRFLRPADQIFGESDIDRAGINRGIEARRPEAIAAATRSIEERQRLEALQRQQLEGRKRAACRLPSDWSDKPLRARSNVSKESVQSFGKMKRSPLATSRSGRIQHYSANRYKRKSVGLHLGSGIYAGLESSIRL
jgi:hypothetical protein